MEVPNKIEQCNKLTTKISQINLTDGSRRAADDCRFVGQLAADNSCSDGTIDGLSDISNDTTNNSSFGSGEEKRDIDPENTKKSCDVTPVDDEIIIVENIINNDDDGDDVISVTIIDSAKKVGGSIQVCDKSIKNCDNKDLAADDGGNSTAAAAVTLETSKALAFTIDFNEGKVLDSKKYNDIVERFQKRHRRGVSLSKLDEPQTALAAASKSKPPLKKAVTNKNIEIVGQQVMLRDKSQLSAKIKDSEQRHSWSPRTSLRVSSPTPAAIPHERIRQQTLNAQSIQAAIFKDNKMQKSELINDEVILFCEEPPLEFAKNSDDDTASEAGTYTLDGDNYTEEQKSRMSIDKQSKQMKRNSQVTSSTITTCTGPPIQDVQNFDEPQKYFEKRNKNTLQVTSYTEPLRDNKISSSTKTSYLDKIKSKVKTIGERTFHKNSKLQNSPNMPSSPDIGSFTSVTSSGVFSKKLDCQPARLKRKNSLTKSQIDSSEFVQRSAVGGNSEKLMNSFTDYEKAQQNEYQLNIFSQKCRQADIPAAEMTIGQTIKTAETKNDWIQEWAKNARRNNAQKAAAAQHPDRRVSNSQKTDRTHEETYYDQRTTNIQNYPSNEEEFGDNLDRNYSPKNTNQRFTKDSSYYNNYQPEQLEQHLDNDHCGTIQAAQILSPKHRLLLQQKQQLADERQYERKQIQQQLQKQQQQQQSNMLTRPPISPTKIPSPMHSMSRARSSSFSRSLHSSTTDLDKNDTEMYLHKTAAAITSLQNIHRNNNSPQSPLSPVRATTNFSSSPSIRRGHHHHHYNHGYLSPQKSLNNYTYNNNNSISMIDDNTLFTSDHFQQYLHKRNLSLDGTELKARPVINNREASQMSHSYNSDVLNGLLNLKQPRTQHARHNSCEEKRSTLKSIDQTFAPQPQLPMRSHNNVRPTSGALIKQSPTVERKFPSGISQNSQIKRSSSFSTKPLVRGVTPSKTLTPKMAPKVNTKPSGLQKSASSTSFKQMKSRYEDEANEFYLNDEDDLNPNLYSSESELSDQDNEKELITNTRYNKAFLIRLEQNKQKSASIQKQGVVACPNTPELPRRDIRVRQSLRDRQSMPRDSSMSRMKQDIPSLNTTKKVLVTTQSAPSPSISAAAKADKEASRKVVPKYLDISKYKPTQGNTFLKRDESKSTLINKEIKRSSSAFVGLNKSDVGRSSVRSVKSASSSGKSTFVVNNTSAANREAELAMWRRRASYDPMKAAAEGKQRKQQDESQKKLCQSTSKYNESSVVLRSQSFHSGVGQLQHQRGNNANENRWTLISTESSEEEFMEN